MACRFDNGVDADCSTLNALVSTGGWYFRVGAVDLRFGSNDVVGSGQSGRLHRATRSLPPSRGHRGSRLHGKVCRKTASP